MAAISLSQPERTFARCTTNFKPSKPKPKPEPEENILISVCTVCGEEHVVPGTLPGAGGEYSCDGVTVKYGRDWSDTRFKDGRTYHPKRGSVGSRPQETDRPLTNNFKTPKPEEKPMSKVDALLSPEAPVVVNEQGGKQSETGVRLDLIPPKALFRVGAILKAGAAKYGELNWHKIPVDSHINHALVHLYAHLAGDTQDDHLGHATCRLQMALERHLMGTEQEAASEIPF